MYFAYILCWKIHVFYALNPFMMAEVKPLQNNRFRNELRLFLALDNILLLQCALGRVEERERENEKVCGRPSIYTIAKTFYIIMHNIE